LIIVFFRLTTLRQTQVYFDLDEFGSLAVKTM